MVLRIVKKLFSLYVLLDNIVEGTKHQVAALKINEHQSIKNMISNASSDNIG